MVIPKVKAKKSPEKRTSKEVVEKVVDGDKKSSSSSQFDNIFDVNYFVPSTKSCRTKGMRILKVWELQAFSPQKCMRSTA